MVHLMHRACGIDPNEWSGFAFSMGFDRLLCLRYGLNDVRKLYNGELVWRTEYGNSLIWLNDYVTSAIAHQNSWRNSRPCWVMQDESAANRGR